MAPRPTPTRREPTLGEALHEAGKLFGPDSFVAEQLRRIESKLDRLLFLKTRDPGPITLVQTGEENSMVKFKVQLPALPADASDIDKAELTVKIGEAEAQVMALGKDATEVDGLSGNPGETVTLSFVYIDAAGNRSVNPATGTFTLADTFPPPDPGTLGLVAVE